MKNTQITQDEKEFLDYFKSFYGTEGLYPNVISGYSEIQVKFGIKMRGEAFCGDSFDREMIRDMILCGREKYRDMEHK